LNFFKQLKFLWPVARDQLVKFLLLKFLPKAVSGPWGWLVVWIGEKAANKILKPAWNWIMRKGYALTRKWKRKPKATRLENADNESDFDDSVDNMP